MNPSYLFRGNFKKGGILRSLRDLGFKVTQVNRKYKNEEEYSQ
jgi:hypothetical protein